MNIEFILNSIDFQSFLHNIFNFPKFLTYVTEHQIYIMDVSNQYRYIFECDFVTEKSYCIIDDECLFKLYRLIEEQGFIVEKQKAYHINIYSNGSLIYHIPYQVYINFGNPIFSKVPQFMKENYYKQAKKMLNQETYSNVCT